MFYKNYFRYIVPSVISFTLTGVYSVIDGFFIGQKVGYLGLAAVGIAWPIAAVTYALGEGIGMGGSVISSIRRGEGREQDSREAIGNSLSMILISALLVTLVVFSLAGILTRLIGADEGTHEMATVYLRTLSMGAIAQIGYCGLLPIVRSLGRPVLAMATMVTGCCVNILLDWLFVWIFGWGVRGAALATISGEFVTAIPLAAFFLFPQNRIPADCFRIRPGVLKHIVRIGVSPFGLSVLPSLSIIIMNLQVVKHGGDTALAAYSLIGYVLSIVQLMAQGVCEGAQPMLSYNTGSGDRGLVRRTARLTYGITVGLGIAGGLLFLLFIRQIALLYNAGPQTTAVLLQAAPFFSLAMPLFCFSRCTADYFYATDRSGSASLMVYLEGLVLMPGLALLLPALMGLKGVWLVTVTTQLLLLCLGLRLLSGRKKTKAPE
ncbi:MAG: hypothetical protein IJG57_04130 [Firmicutes bacterium]|jgi:putative MATE family efflux protein|nr:hypothetical protein [Bacillota bacterium]